MSAPDLALCSAQDVIDCFGGDTATMNKWTKGGTTTFDTSTLTKPILVASADYARCAGNKFNLPYSADPTVYPMDVRNLVALRAAMYFALFNSQMQAMPDMLKDRIAWCDKEFDAVRDGKVGTSPQKVLPPRIGGAIVDTTMGGQIERMSLSAWGRI